MTGGAKVAPGSPSASGTRGSGPASTESSRARSSTLRAIGPEIPSASHWFSDGHAGTRPRLGRSPYTPQNDAGLRRLPPMSEPSASGTMPEASAHAAPPLDPPALRVGSTGLRVVPKIVLNVWLPAANSGTFVFPIGTAPARRIRSTTSSSRSGTLSASSGEPYVVSHPATSWVSLNAHGSPCSGPRSSYGVRSASLAPSRARSSSRLTIAFSSGLLSRDAGEVEVHQLRAGDLAAARSPPASRGPSSSMVRSFMGWLPRQSLRFQGDVATSGSAAIPGEPGIAPAHRRRPNSAPATTPRRTRPAPTAMPLTKSACEETPEDGGAVKTWPATGAASGDDATGAAARRAGQGLVDVAEELAGHPLRDRGQHPLADAADHPADDRVGVPGHAGGPVAAVGEADVHRRADRPRRTGTVELHHQRRRLGEVREHARAGVRALDRGHAGGDGHVVGVLPRRDQPLAAGDGRDEHGGVQQRVPGPLDGGVQDVLSGDPHDVSSESGRAGARTAPTARSAWR